MAYGKLAEGARPWDPVEDGDIDDRDLAELMDQLKVMLGPNDYQIGIEGDAESGWADSFASDPPYRTEANAANLDLVIELPFLREGMKILSASLLLGGNADGTEAVKGSIKLYRVPIEDSGSRTGAGTFTPASGDVWERGGVGPFVLAWSSINHVVLADSRYYLVVESVGDGVGGDECYWYGGVMRCQFGN